MVSKREAEEMLEREVILEINEIIENVKKLGEEYKGAPQESRRDRLAAIGILHTIKGELRRFRIFIGRADRIAMRFRRNLSKAGKELGKEDMMVVTICNGMSTTIRREEKAILDPMIKEVKSEEGISSHLASEVEKLHQKLEQMRAWILRLIAFDEKMKKELEGKE